MSLLKQATGIGGHSGEELKHEGVMDMFKGKNIQTTERSVKLIDNLNMMQSFDTKNWCWLVENFFNPNPDEDNNNSNITIKDFVTKNLNEIKKYNQYLSQFINGNTKKIIINKDTKSIKREHLSMKVIVQEISKGIKHNFNTTLDDGIVSKNKKILKDTEFKELKEQNALFAKVAEILNKENEFTKEEVTVETAINQDWLATKNEIQLLSETASTFTTESASNFISNIKTFFTNSLMGINNALSNFMKTYTITDKYFKDNVNMLNSKSSVINSIISKKFFEIENIETKCVVGMKLNYLGTTKELKIFASKIPEIKTSIDGVSNFIENLYNNHNDARLSNIKNLDNLTELSSKTTEIISELIDGKSIKENVTIGNLFPNSNGIKIVKDELIEVNNILYKADVEALNKSVNRLISVVTIFLKEINENEATYSKGVINSLQYSVKETADIITNFGTFLVLSNQFTSYYLTTIDVIKDNAK